MRRIQSSRLNEHCARAYDRHKQPHNEFNSGFGCIMQLSAMQPCPRYTLYHAEYTRNEKKAHSRARESPKASFMSTCKQSPSGIVGNELVLVRFRCHSGRSRESLSGIVGEELVLLRRILYDCTIV